MTLSCTDSRWTRYPTRVFVFPFCSITITITLCSSKYLKMLHVHVQIQIQEKFYNSCVHMCHKSCLMASISALTMAGGGTSGRTWFCARESPLLLPPLRPFSSSPSIRPHCASARPSAEGLALRQCFSLNG